MFTNQKKKKQKTRAIPESTAGGMVYRRTGKDNVDILMIQDRKGRWTIPKGHVEPGESLEQTALREVAEETGLNDLAIRGKLDKVHFFYRREGKLISMTTHIYLMEALGDTNALMPENSEGIADAKWFSGREALKQIEYSDIKKLFYHGFAKLRGKKHGI